MGTVFVIVGASKGFGRALIKECIRKHSGKPVDDQRHGCLLLTSCKERCTEVWNDTYSEAVGRSFTPTEANIQLIIEEVDLSDVSCSSKFGDSLDFLISQFNFQINRYLVFFNAGSVTPVGPMLSHLEAVGTAQFDLQLAHHCNLNFVSFVSNLRTILRTIIKRELHNANASIRVVNISSLAAVKLLHGMSVYGAIKGAREAIVAGLAHELICTYPKLDAKLLNYSPGPMCTDMVLNDLIGTASAANFVKEHQPKFVDCEESAKKCICLLTECSSKWKSGSRIDFFDSV